MKDIFIIGGGGVGKEVAYIIEQINEAVPTYNILGFIDDSKQKWGSKILGYEVLGGLDYLEKINFKGSLVIAIANYSVKKSMVERLSYLNANYPIIKHPKVKLHKSVQVGEGSILYEGIIISPDVKIGKQVIISPKCGIGHDTIIEDYVLVLWNVNISGSDYIEEGVLLGAGSTIIQGKRVKKGSIIGAGAVVIRDIEKKGTFVGVPAKLIEGY